MFIIGGASMISPFGLKNFFVGAFAPKSPSSGYTGGGGGRSFAGNRSPVFGSLPNPIIVSVLLPLLRAFVRSTPFQVSSA
jgi:hypothetical protein